MSRGLNLVQIIGHLGGDPEVRQTTSGVSVANFNVATSDQWKDKQTGEKKEATQWHRIVAFNQLAEIMGQYLRKGAQVYIAGKLQTRSYEKDGETKYITEIVASQMLMLGSKGGSDRAEQQAAAQGAVPASQSACSAPAPASDGEPFDDDIPF